jgi:hypothetical protein
MKITESTLKNIINEEIAKMIEEGWFDRLRARTAGGLKSMGGKAKGALQRGVGKVATAVGSKEAGAALQKKGEETSASAAAKGTGVRIKTILNTHVKEMENDLAKLGLAEDDDVIEAMTQLRASLANAIQRSQGTA